MDLPKVLLLHLVAPDAPRGEGEGAHAALSAPHAALFAGGRVGPILLFASTNVEEFFHFVCVCGKLAARVGSIDVHQATSVDRTIKCSGMPICIFYHRFVDERVIKQSNIESQI